MFLIVGLGNPGKEYEKTRHNIGFMSLDKIAAELNIDIKKEKFKGLIGEGIFNNQKILLLKPQTYMNLSGDSIRQVVDFYKISLENLIVIYDDIDIEECKFKIRKKGRSGSHNGMKSVISSLNSENFARIRIGIGKPHINEDLKDYVLKRITNVELKNYEETLNNVVSSIKSIIIEGIDSAMNKFN